MHEVEVYMYVFFVVLVVVNIHTYYFHVIYSRIIQIGADARENIFEELECLQYSASTYV